MALKSLSPAILPEEFFPRYAIAKEFINKVFADVSLKWSHGHFRPDQVFRLPNRSEYMLIDFGHSKMYPEGYELAMIIWGDHLTKDALFKNYEDWREGIFSWIKDLEPLATRLGYKRYDVLMAASLVERIFGTILADIGATNMALPEKKKKISWLYRLFDELSQAI